MRLITRLTDTLVDRLAPKGVVAAACTPRRFCTCNTSGNCRECEVRQNCDTHCRNVFSC